MDAQALSKQLAAEQRSKESSDAYLLAITAHEVTRSHAARIMQRLWRKRLAMLQLLGETKGKGKKDGKKKGKAAGKGGKKVATSAAKSTSGKAAKKPGVKKAVASPKKRA